MIGALFDAELALSAAQTAAKVESKLGRQAHMLASSPQAKASLVKGASMKDMTAKKKGSVVTVR